MKAVGVSESLSVTKTTGSSNWRCLPAAAEVSYDVFQIIDLHTLPESVPERDPKIHVLDLTADFLNANGVLKKALFTPDNIHLSLDGYGVYAAKLKPALDKLLGGKGAAAALQPAANAISKPGSLRVPWGAHANRANSASIAVQSADGEKIVTLNQTKATEGANGFQAIGEFRFYDTRHFAIVFKVVGSQGIVHIDAMQVVPAKSESKL